MARIAAKAEFPGVGTVQEVMNIAWQISQNYVNVPYSLIIGMIWVESKFDPTSYRYNYDNAADRSYGLMHLTIPTANWVSSSLLKMDWEISENDLYDPWINLYLGMVYFSYLLRRYNNSQNDALSAYNAGHSLKTLAGTFANGWYINSVMLGINTIRGLLGV